jgi:hypothetical protein
MSSSSPGPLRRLARVFVGLSVIPQGLFTAFLFLHTARPMPSAFTLTGHNGVPEFEFPHFHRGKTTFFRFSQSGRCFSTIEVTDSVGAGDEARLDMLVTIWDSSTFKQLHSFTTSSNPEGHDLSYISQGDVTPDRRRLFVKHKDTIDIQDLTTGRKEVVDIRALWGQEPPEFVQLSPSAQEFLMVQAGRVIVYDWAGKRKLTDKCFPTDYKIRQCFFDDQGRALALVECNNFEIWDLGSDALVKNLGSRPTAGKTSWDGTFARFWYGSDAAGAYVLNYDEEGALWIRSMPQGRALHRLNVSYKPHLNSSAKPLILYWYGKENPLVSFTKEWNLPIPAWLSDHFPEKTHLALLDLETDSSWFDLAGNYAAFTQDDNRLITLTKEGFYEYDLPPRMRWFTPWAWAGLTAWLGSIILWWKLRARSVAVKRV